MASSIPVAPAESSSRSLSSSADFVAGVSNALVSYPKEARVFAGIYVEPGFSRFKPSGNPAPNPNPAHRRHDDAIHDDD
jgi:hypothetical protein